MSSLLESVYLLIILSCFCLLQNITFHFKILFNIHKVLFSSFPTSIATFQSDKDGLLALSNKQKSLLSRWVRPSDYINGPKMILAISCFSICQTVVTDCSFVASMAIAAQYERRFKKKLITK